MYKQSNCLDQVIPRYCHGLVISYNQINDRQVFNEERYGRNYLPPYFNIESLRPGKLATCTQYGSMTKNTEGWECLRSSLVGIGQ